MAWRAIGVGLLALAALLPTAPAHAAWQMAETEHFRVYSQGDAAGLTRQAALLEDYRSLLLKMTNAPPPVADAPRLDIFLVNRMAMAQPYSRIASDIAGFYTARPGRIAAFVETSQSGQPILLHEYAHHFMLASGAVAYPSWYVEGFAEYFMTATFKPERIEFGLADANRAVWLLNAPWQPLDRLISARPKLRSSSDRAVYYAQSWLLTHYMFRAPGMPEKFDAYLKAVAAGEESVAAFRRHVDPDLVGLQSKLRRYLTGSKATFTRFSRPAGTPASVRLSRLSPSATRLLIPLTLLELGLDDDEKAKALADVRGKVADLGDDPLAQRTLALAELEHGDRATGRATIDRLLVAAPDDPVLLRWRAAAVAASAAPGSRDAARRLLARSFKRDPSDWRTLRAYVGLFDPMSTRLDKPTLDVLLRAYELAPQVPEIALETAVALTRNDQLADDAKVLAPLAYAPHGGTLATRAAAMLVAARADDQAAVLAALTAREPDDYDDAAATSD
jgi:hypothetical protein